MKQARRVLAALGMMLLLALFGFLAPPLRSRAASAGWVKTEAGYSYTDEKGQYRTGWQKIDGLWHFFNPDGSLYHGWPTIDGRTQYVSAGARKTATTGLVKSSSKDNRWLYVKNGVWQKDYTGFYTSAVNGKTFYVVKGVWASGTTALIKRSADNKWLYIKAGVWQKEYTGFYTSASNGKTFYVVKGIWAGSTTALIKRNTDNKWVYVKGGYFQETYTGLYTSAVNGKTFYVAKGIWASGTTALIKRVSDNKWVYMKGGVFQKDFSGIYISKYGEGFYLLKGVWQNTVSGKKLINQVYYTLKGGKVWIADLEPWQPSSRANMLKLMDQYDPDGAFIIRSQPEYLFNTYLSGSLVGHAVQDMNTIVHELTHAYSWQGSQFGVAERIYLGNGAYLDVPYTRVFDSIEMVSAIPEGLRTYRFNTYIATDRENLTSRKQGAYGLLNELAAYYWGFHAGTGLSPYADFYSVSDGVEHSNCFLAYAEFRYYILQYLLYAKEHHYAVYEGIIGNTKFRKAFTAIDTLFGKEVKKWIGEQSYIYDKYMAEYNALMSKMEETAFRDMAKKLRP